MPPAGPVFRQAAADLEAVVDLEAVADLAVVDPEAVDRVSELVMHPAALWGQNE